MVTIYSILRNAAIISVLLTLLPSIAAGEDITVVTESLPPYQIVEGDRIGGFSTDVVRAVLEEVGMDATIRAYPWVRAYGLALREKNVLIYSIVRTQEREDLFHWVGIITEVDGYIYKLKTRDDIVINTLDDAKKYITAVVNDDFNHHLLIKEGFKLGEHFYLVDSWESKFLMLFLNRTDLVISTDVTMAYTARSLGYDPDELTAEFSMERTSGSYYMAFSRSTPIEVVEQFREGLKKVKKSRVLKKIRKKWGLSPQ